MSALLILGAGGHGKVVADTARISGFWSDIAFVDDRYPTLESVNGIQVLGNCQKAKVLRSSFPSAVVAIGNNSRRYELVQEIQRLGFELPVIIHPSAVVAESASIAGATVIFANAVIQASAKLGIASIVNTSASVDHDCVIGTAVHIASGVHLGGEVIIGDFSLLGVGVSVIRGVRIGTNSIIGAGGCVVSDIDSDSVAVGVPAKNIRKNV